MSRIFSLHHAVKENGLPCLGLLVFFGSCSGSLEVTRLADFILFSRAVHRARSTNHKCGPRSRSQPRTKAQTETTTSDEGSQKQQQQQHTAHAAADADSYLPLKRLPVPSPVCRVLPSFFAHKFISAHSEAASMAAKPRCAQQCAVDRGPGTGTGTALVLFVIIISAL